MSDKPTKHRWVGMGGSGNVDWCYRCGALRMVLTTTDTSKIGPYYIPSGAPVSGYESEPKCENHNPLTPDADLELTNKLRWEALRQLFAKLIMADPDATDAELHLAQIVQIFEGEDDVGVVLEDDFSERLAQGKKASALIKDRLGLDSPFSEGHGDELERVREINHIVNQMWGVNHDELGHDEMELLIDDLRGQLKHLFATLPASDDGIGFTDKDTAQADRVKLKARGDDETQEGYQ